MTLRWSPVDDATGDPLPGYTYNQDAAVLGRAQSGSGAQWPTWTPSQTARGRYLFRVVPLDNKHRPLAEVDSRLVTQTAAQGASRWLIRWLEPAVLDRVRTVRAAQLVSPGRFARA